MAIICVIRYQIDPFQKDALKKYRRTGVASFPAAAGVWSNAFFLRKAQTT